MSLWQFSEWFVEDSQLHVLLGSIRIIRQWPPSSRQNLPGLLCSWTCKLSIHKGPGLTSERNRRNGDCKRPTPNSNTKRRNWLYLKENHAELLLRCEIQRQKSKRKTLALPCKVLSSSQRNQWTHNLLYGKQRIASAHSTTLSFVCSTGSRNLSIGGSCSVLEFCSPRSTIEHQACSRRRKL